MAFETDTRLAEELGKMFGDYLVTFLSEHHQVRADLFRRGGRVEAHVSFPTGLTPGAVTDRYVSDLRAYAHEHGFEDRLHLILS